MAVHAVLVGRYHLCPLSAIGHDQILTVAGSAGARNIGMVHPRFRIARRQKLVRAAMAIDTSSCSVISRRNCLGMEASIVSGLFISMAFRAGDLLGRAFMSCTLDVTVAIHAGEHSAANGVFERLGIYVEADRLSAYLMAECRVAVAGKAFIRAGLGRMFFHRLKSSPEKQQSENNSERKNSPTIFLSHALTRQSLTTMPTRRNRQAFLTSLFSQASNVAH